MTPEALAAVHSASFETPRAWSAAEFAALLADPMVFAVGDETGFAFGRVVADEAELLTLAVAPQARRQGLARACLTGFDKAARARGAATAFLEVAAGSAPAIALYHGAGWRETGRRPAYYRHGDGRREDALILTKPLI